MFKTSHFFNRHLFVYLQILTVFYIPKLILPSLLPAEVFFIREIFFLIELQKNFFSVYRFILVIAKLDVKFRNDHKRVESKKNIIEVLSIQNFLFEIHRTWFFSLYKAKVLDLLKILAIDTHLSLFSDVQYRNKVFSIWKTYYQICERTIHLYHWDFQSIENSVKNPGYINLSLIKSWYSLTTIAGYFVTIDNHVQSIQ